mgnify:CR=1 FL=1
MKSTFYIFAITIITTSCIAERKMIEKIAFKTDYKFSAEIETEDKLNGIIKFKDKMAKVEVRPIEKESWHGKKLRKSKREKPSPSRSCPAAARPRLWRCVTRCAPEVWEGHTSCIIRQCLVHPAA